MSSTVKAHTGLFTVSLIFGANYWIAKGLMPGFLTPEQLTFIRIAGALLLFFFFSKLTASEKVERKDLIRIFIAGMFGTTVNQFLFFKGLNLTTPVDVAFIHVSNPVFTLLFAMILLGEKLTLTKATGIFLGATGAVILLLYRGNISLSSDTFTGNLLALLNAIVYALYLVMIKPMMDKYKPVTVLKWVFLSGLIFSVPLTFSSMLRISFVNFTAFSWFSLVYVIVITTFLGYLITIFSLKYVDASVTSYYVYLQPLIATAVAFYLGMQYFTWMKALAALLIFAGVYLVSRNPAKSVGGIPFQE